MIFRKVLQGAIGAAALFAATLVTVSSADAQCARRYTGEASGLLRAATGIAARADWRLQVRRDLGFGYALWSRAANRVTRCYRRPAGGNWQCRATARPCG
jgi:hypothetical protein